MARVKKWFAQMKADLWQEWFDRAEKLSKKLEACRISGIVVVDEDWETEDPEDLRYKVEIPCLTCKQVQEVITLLNQPLPTKSAEPCRLSANRPGAVISPFAVTRNKNAIC